MNVLCHNEFADHVDDWNANPISVRRVADFAQDWSVPKSVGSAYRRERPGKTYSKRSMKLAQLRNDAAALRRLDFEETTSPSAPAMRAAETFINSLWEGCLGFDLEISHDGEINFLYGSETELFHIYIDENGVLSFYCKRAEGETFGDDVSADNFPNKDLMSFVDRRK